MPDSTTTPGGVEDAVVEAARAGDEAAFAELVGRYRRELHVHCYRMLGSFEEAEDLVQEAFLRAWRRRGSFQGGPGFRAWLYKITMPPHPWCFDGLDAIRPLLSQGLTEPGRVAPRADPLTAPGQGPGPEPAPGPGPTPGPGEAAATRLGTTMRHASTTSSSISAWSMASSHTRTQW